MLISFWTNYKEKWIKRGGMAGSDQSRKASYDPAQALTLKEKGNKLFQAGDYAGAEVLYSKAYVIFELILNKLTHHAG